MVGGWRRRLPCQSLRSYGSRRRSLRRRDRTPTGILRRSPERSLGSYGCEYRDDHKQDNEFHGGPSIPEPSSTVVAPSVAQHGCLLPPGRDRRGVVPVLGASVGPPHAAEHRLPTQSTTAKPTPLLAGSRLCRTCRSRALGRTKADYVHGRIVRFERQPSPSTASTCIRFPV